MLAGVTAPKLGGARPWPSPPPPPQPMSVAARVTTTATGGSQIGVNRDGGSSMESRMGKAAHATE